MLRDINQNLAAHKSLWGIAAWLWQRTLPNANQIAAPHKKPRKLLSAVHPMPPPLANHAIVAVRVFRLKRKTRPYQCE